MINNKDTAITILKDCIDFMGQKLYPPFAIDEVKSVLGEGRYVLAYPELNVQNQVWDELGIFGWLNSECTEITAWGICIDSHENNLPSDLYEGKILIDKKNYTECNWEFDGFSCQEIKHGCFILNTLLPHMLSQVKDNTIATLAASRIEIDYVEF